MTLKVTLRKGVGPGLQFYVSQKVLRNYLGDNPYFISITCKGIEVIRYCNPLRQRPQFEVPSSFGEEGEEIDITIMKITESDFLSKAYSTGKISFKPIIKSDGTLALFIDGKEILADILKGLFMGATRLYLILGIMDQNTRRYTRIEVAWNGYEDPNVYVLWRKEKDPSQTQYIGGKYFPESDVLEIYYRSSDEEDPHVNTIFLSKPSSINIFLYGSEYQKREGAAIHG